MTSLDDQLRANDNFGPGFNFARIVLAYGVVAWHAVAIAENGAERAAQSVVWPFMFAILPMFFALSGFLVTGSAMRLPLREYLLNRGFRIVPALGVDIAISALIIGSLFTVLPLTDYFADPDFWEYFGNIVGLIQYDLPGVFESNTYPGIVNGALWTIPYEIACYVLMSAMIIFGIIRSWRWTLALAVAIVAGATVLHVMGLGRGEGFLDRGIRFAFFAKGATLVPAFLVGAVLFLLKEKVPYSGTLAGLLAVLYVGAGLVGGPELASHPAYIGFSAFPLAYIVVWIGLTPIPIPRVLERGDYSYGIYLYHFPIMQALQLLLGFSRWWVLLLGCLLPVTLFAMFSWHMIEKPVLKLRKRFSLVGARLAKGKG